jgi:hypothetical protein
MGKASRAKRERKNESNSGARFLPVFQKEITGIADWDGPQGYATGAAVKLLSEQGHSPFLLGAYETTGLLPNERSVNGFASEELLAWGAAVNTEEKDNWEEFSASNLGLVEKLQTHPAIDVKNSTVATLIDLGWALSIGWPANTAGDIVEIIERDDDSELGMLVETAALMIATLKNDGVFTNKVTQNCVAFGEEFNVGDLVRSYLGSANVEASVVRNHEDNSAAVMLAVHSAIMAGAITAGVTGETFVIASERN